MADPFLAHATFKPYEDQLSMEAGAFDQMARIEAAHWWWEGRRRLFRRILAGLRREGHLTSGTLYDLGCGVGSNLPVLESFGPAIGFDGSPRAVEFAHQLGHRNVHLAPLDPPTPEPLAGEDACFVLLADVIEHLDDEAPTLRLARDLLRPRGHLLVTVPALPALRGPTDDFLHHRRRYTRSSLARTIAPHFSIRRLTYFNTLLLPPIAIARFLQRVLDRPGGEEAELPSRPMNAMLRWTFSAEVRLLDLTNLPLGVSLLCLAERTANGD